MIVRKTAIFDFGDLHLQPVENADFLKTCFYLEFPVPKKEFLDHLKEDFVLLEAQGALTLKLIRRSYGDKVLQIESLRDEGCFYFREEEEWILEAACTMCTADGAYQDTYMIRLPLSAPFAAEGILGFCFDGTWLRFVKAGRVLNENSGLDCFVESADSLQIVDQWKNAFRVGRIKQVGVSYTEEEDPGNADFYSPKPWNSFAGDVMNFYHGGVYHLLYLRDRRHCGTRNYNGAHDIRQLTSTDLVHWEEQEPVTVIDKPWLAYGTGTMLFHNGKYYMTYGFHTERYQGGREQVTCRWEEEIKGVPLLSCDEILREGKLPAGASFSVSEDGIHFVPSGVLFHPGRNPSTYATADGKLKLYAGYLGSGIWESESFEQPFCQTGEDFSFVERSVMKNSTECPSFFEWNGYRYLVIGFTGYFRSLSTDDGTYVDMAGKEEIYDGLGVPMVASFRDGRKLIAGWIGGVGRWGSVIIHRELLQEENGRLGMKWVPEMIPETESDNLLAGVNEIICQDESALTEIEPYTGYLLEMIVDPCNASRMALSFESGERAAQLQLDFRGKRMQVTDSKAGAWADPIPTTFEVALELGESFAWSSPDLWIASNSRNFCMSEILGMEEPFSLKILLRYSRKLRSTVIDVQVAERRTMISERCSFFPDKVSLLSQGQVRISECSLKKLK